MKNSRSLFIYILRHCKILENQKRAYSMASKLAEKDCIGFWNDIKTRFKKSTLQSNQIEGATGTNDILVCGNVIIPICSILLCTVMMKLIMLTQKLIMPSKKSPVLME